MSFVRLRPKSRTPSEIVLLWTMCLLSETESISSFSQSTLGHTSMSQNNDKALAKMCV